MLRKCLAGLALLLFAQPAAADDPRKVAVGPGSTKGALLFNAPPAPVHQLLLFTRDGDPSSRAYWVAIKARPTAQGDQFIATTFPPGQYRLNAVYQQDKWVACLQASTLTVAIEPGKIAYLGTLDTRPTLGSIQRNARAKNDLRAYLGQWHFYRSNIVAPRVADRDPGGLARAEGFVRRHMPKSSASATLADLQWGPYLSAEPSGRADQCD